jgi:hypothetical protein
MGTDMITDYLDTLRARLQSRRDAEDLVAEIEDHLRAHVETLVRDGQNPDDAARLSLESFGDPNVVARAYLVTPAGKLAVPTVSTRAAGALAGISALLWLGLLAIWAIGAALDHTLSGPAADYLFYFAGVLVLAGASGLMCAVAFAIRERHGGTIGVVGTVGLGALILGAVSALVVGWAVPIWMTLLGAGAVCVAVAILRRPFAPRAPAVLFGLALPAGAATFAVARSLEIGRPDENGDYPVALFAALTIGCALSAAAMLAVGLWLTREEPFAIENAESVRA